MNSVIKRKLMKVKRPPKSIDQWYKCTTNLYIYWRVCQRKEERLREKKKSGGQKQK